MIRSVFYIALFRLEEVQKKKNKNITKCDFKFILASGAELARI